MKKTLGFAALALAGTTAGLALGTASAANLPPCAGQGAMNVTYPTGFDCENVTPVPGTNVTLTTRVHWNNNGTGSVLFVLSRAVNVKVGFQARVHDGVSSSSVFPFESFTTLPPGQTSTTIPLGRPVGATKCFAQTDIKAQPGVEGSGGHWDAKWRVSGATYVFDQPAPLCQQQTTTSAAPTTVAAATTVPGSTTPAPLGTTVAPGTTAAASSSGTLPATGGGSDAAPIALVAVGTGLFLLVVATRRLTRS